MLKWLTENIGFWGRFATVVGFFITSGIALYQFQQSIVQDRAATTLEFYRQFTNPPLTEQRKRLSALSIKNKQKIIRAAKENRLGALLAGLRNTEVEVALVSVLEFYDALYSCWKLNACSREMVEQLFSRNAADTYLLYFDYIKESQKTAGPEFGSGVKALAVLATQ